MNFSDILEVATQTDSGMVRSHNEDCIASDPENGVVVLADGMGGHNAGEVASGIAVAMMTTGMKQALAGKDPSVVDEDGHQALGVRILKEQVAKANASIYQAAQSQPQCAGMGTTLVTALYYDNKVTVAHIGDSRMYRLRGEKLEQITRDHSLLQEQIDSGFITPEQAKLSQNKNLVTRALGIDAEVEPEIHDHAAQPGDIYLLCSDGLSDMVDDEEIRQTLCALGSNMQLAAQQLVQMANDNGGRDNVSVILVKVLRDYPVQHGLLARILSWFK